MARYYDLDTLFKHYRALANIEWNKKVAPISWCDAYEEIADHIAELPAADVVPRAEAENYKSIAEHQQKLSMDRYFEIKQLKQDIEGYKHLEVILNTAVDKLRSELEAEVAREIFEEIERGIAELYPILYVPTLNKFFTELKKKYTEGEK